MSLKRLVGKSLQGGVPETKEMQRDNSRKFQTASLIVQLSFD